MGEDIVSMKLSVYSKAQNRGGTLLVCGSRGSGVWVVLVGGCTRELSLPIGKRLSALAGYVASARAQHGMQLFQPGPEDLNNIATKAETGTAE